MALHWVHCARLRAATAVFSVLFIAGCGGGGGGDDASIAAQGNDAGPMPSTTARAVATIQTSHGSKAAWNTLTNVEFSLRDAAGTAVNAPLSCASDAPSQLSVAPDCKSLTGHRLGTHTVTVSGGDTSAKVSVKIIPQPKPLGTGSPDSTDGTNQTNLVVTQDGRVLAWGGNRLGALGQGQNLNQLTHLPLPTAVKDPTGHAPLHGIVAVSAGDSSALALTEDGDVYSWGFNAQNQLGRPTTSNIALLPGKVLGTTGSGTLRNIVSVSMGASNALALGDDGTVYSWGYNSGQPGPDPKRSPGIVRAPEGGELRNAVAISAGWNWAMVLLADGRVASWGFGDDGRHGQGTASAPMPGYVVTEADRTPLADVVAISAGFKFGMALTSKGQIYTWGANESGQLGQNVLDYKNYLRAVPVKSGSGNAPLENILMVAAGGSHALAMDDKGRVLSWGSPDSAQLGDGPNHPRRQPSPTPAPVVSESGTGELRSVRTIAAGYWHSLALADDGTLYIWGDGFGGNLGQGGSSYSDSFLPLAVKDESGNGKLALGPLSYWPNLLQRGR